MNSEAALTETWIGWIYNPGATIIKSSSCYESDSRYTKHYQQFWRYHNHISGLMPLTNSYLTTILVCMFWHSGELHILAPLALLFTMFPSSYHHKIFRSHYQWQKWCPCKRSRSEVKGQGHRGQNPIYPFPDCNSSWNSHMAMKSCLKLDVA